MLRHVAMFRWNEGVDADQVALIAEAIDRLPGAISEIRAYAHGPDLGLADQNFDYVVVGDFDSVADFEAYRDHPRHQALIGELLAPALALRAAIQYDVSG